MNSDHLASYNFITVRKGDIFQGIVFKLNKTWIVFSLDYCCFAFVDLYLFFWCCFCATSATVYCLFPFKQSVLKFRQWVGSRGSIRRCSILTSWSDWVSSISWEQPSPFLHTSLHQGLCLSWPARPVTPPSTDSPMRLQDSNTVGWSVQQHNTTLQGKVKLSFVWFALTDWLASVCACVRV